MPGATRALIAITLTAARRPDQPPQQAVDAVLRAEGPRPRVGEPGGRVDARILERGERHVGGELGAAQREAQPVAGHRIDEAGGVAGQEQAGHAGRAGVDGERAEDRPARSRGARRGERGPSTGSRGEVPLEEPRRIARSPSRAGVTRQTLARPASPIGATPM